MLVELGIALALQTNAGLYLNEITPYTEDLVVSLKIEERFENSGFFAKLEPYVSKSKQQSSIGNGGAFAGIGWENDKYRIELKHHSKHNMDIETKHGSLNVDQVVLTFKFD